MQKEIPILFSTPMVQAILQGRKTMTRRIVPEPFQTWLNDATEEWKKEIHTQSRYGKPGDILYVRESWCDWMHGEVWYKASYQPNMASAIRWKPSIHLKKSKSRIWLEVTDVRVERLHDITEEDAKAEGVANGNIFRSLWQQINGNWDSNPWVWVVSFKVLSTTGKPILHSQSSILDS